VTLCFSYADSRPSSRHPRTVDDAQDDLDFCLDGLGLRLVKKTVNFDNHHVYHFYYGDRQGTPGTIWTTFPYKDRGVANGRKGAVRSRSRRSRCRTARSIAGGRGLGARAVAVTDVAARFGDAVIRFADRSGLTFELIAAAHDDRTPWVADASTLRRRFAGCTASPWSSRDAAKTVELMTSLLDYTVVDEMESRIRLAVNGAGPGETIDVAHHADAEPAMKWSRHGAITSRWPWRARDEQLRLREELLRYGCKVTEVRDRCYFPVDLLPGTGRRAVRGRDGAARVRGR